MLCSATPPRPRRAPTRSGLLFWPDQRDAAINGHAKPALLGIRELLTYPTYLPLGGKCTRWASRPPCSVEQSASRCPVAIKPTLVDLHHGTYDCLRLGDSRVGAPHHLSRSVLYARGLSPGNSRHPSEYGTIGDGAPEPAREPQSALNDEVRQVMRDSVEGCVTWKLKRNAIVASHPRRGHLLGAPCHDDFHGPSTSAVRRRLGSAARRARPLKPEVGQPYRPAPSRFNLPEYALNRWSMNERSPPRERPRLRPVCRVGLRPRDRIQGN